MEKIKFSVWASAVVMAMLFSSGPAGAGSDVDKRIQEFNAGADKGTTEHKAVEKSEAVVHDKDGGSVQTEKDKKKTGKKSAHQEKKKHAGDSSHETAAVSPEEALKRLMEGNKRYEANKSAKTHLSPQRRNEVAKGQHPFAVVIGCSDSRVPPEILFDQGLGDLFVVRTAGNTVDALALGSIEYAVEHLGVTLIMVLGHERCGAVDATVKGGEASGNLRVVIDAIRPAVEKVKGKALHGHDCDFLCSAVKSNVKHVAEKIRTASPVLAEFMEDGLLKVVGGYYDLDTGSVSMTYKPYL